MATLERADITKLTAAGWKAPEPFTVKGRDGTTDLYFGKSNYRLTTNGDSLRIREKRCLLGSEGLRPHGRISIVL